MIARSVRDVIMTALTVVQDRRPPAVELSCLLCSNFLKKSLDSSGENVPSSDCCPRFLRKARSWLPHGVQTKVLPCSRPSECGYSIPQNLHRYCNVVSGWVPADTDMVPQEWKNSQPQLREQAGKEHKNGCGIETKKRGKHRKTPETRGQPAMSRQTNPRTR